LGLLSSSIIVVVAGEEALGLEREEFDSGATSP